MANPNLSQHTITAYLKQILGPRRNVKIPMYDYAMIIGRSKKADIVSSDPNVSRNHCILKYSPTEWSIKDLGSVNGTYVNNTRISNDSYFLLSDGDEIYFGPRSDAPEAYKFESVKTSTESSSQGNPHRKVLRNKTPSPQKPAVKRKVSPKHSNSSDKDSVITTVVRRGIVNVNFEPSDQEQHMEDGYHSESSVSSCESLRTRINKLNNNVQKKKQKRRKFCGSSENLAVPSTSSVKHPLGQGPRFNFNKLNFLGGKSDDEDSESLLHQEISDKKSEVISKEMIIIDPNSSDSDSSAVDTLKKDKRDLIKTVAILKKRMLIMESEKAKSDEALKNRENSDFDLIRKGELARDAIHRNLLEEDMICNICTELYIKPVNLGCHHTFCQHCINEWKKKKKQCPICRERIETESIVLFLDDYISKALKLFDPAALQKRADLIKSREEMQQKKTPKRKKCRGSSNRRRNAVSGPSGRNNPSVNVDEMQALRERITSIQSYSDDIQAYVDVIDDLIQDDYIDSDDAYGRIIDARHFGPCYNCGRTGHWANECPHD